MESSRIRVVRAPLAPSFSAKAGAGAALKFFRARAAGEKAPARFPRRRMPARR